MYHSLDALFHDTIFIPLTEYLPLQAQEEYYVGKLISKATELAKSTFHFSEHWEKKDTTLTRALITQHCPRFPLLKSIADAAKHATLTHPNAKIKKATAIEEVLNAIIFSDGDGQYQHGQPRVFVEIEGKKREDLISIIVEVSNFYATRLLQKGEIRLDRRIHYDSQFKFVYRSQVQGFTVFGLVGSEHHVRIIMWGYNPITKDFEELIFEEGTTTYRGKVIQRITKEDAKPRPW